VGTTHEPRIFLSYRRSDSAGWAGRLHDSLGRLLPSMPVFMDVESIPPGADFKQFIADKVSRCSLLIALIGPQWSDARDEEGHRRLDSPEDFTRIEVESALKSGIWVIPVLVGGAKMPKAAELPESLRPLTGRNAFELSDQSWEAGCNRLARGIQETVPLPPPDYFGKKYIEAAVAQTEIIAREATKPERRRTVLAWVGGVVLIAASVLAARVWFREPPSVLDLGLEGIWRVGALGDLVRFKIERTGDSLRLYEDSVFLGGPNGEFEQPPHLAIARIAPDSISIDFDGNGLTGLVARAKPSARGEWTVTWSNAPTECANAVSVESSFDLRTWRATCGGSGTSRPLREYTATLHADGSIITLTQREANRGSTLVLQREPAAPEPTAPAP
jgi:hypothetical protein